MPRVGICGGLGVNSEVPNVKIDFLGTQHLHDCIFSWRQGLLWRYLEPLSRADLFYVSRNEVPFLRRLSRESHLQIANDSDVTLGRRSDDAEAVAQRNFIQRSLIDVEVYGGRVQCGTEFWRAALSVRTSVLNSQWD